MSATPTVKTYEVEADCAGSKQSTVTVRDLALEVDVPETSGGENHGPTAVEYLLASLAGCFHLTGTHVAAEMGLDLTVRSVSVSGDLDTTTFLTGEGNRAGYGRIRAAVDVETTVTAKELDEWRRETEHRNPVLDTITRPTPVEFDVTVRFDRD